MNAEFVEITTHIGCPINCAKYCPQEITVKNYGENNRSLTVDNFKIALNNLPDNLPVVFSGFCEPFANKDAIKFIRYSIEKKHPVVVNTTLVGASDQDIDELASYKYAEFCLHLPDGEHAHIQITEKYKEHVFTVIQKVHNVTFDIMNDNFASNNRENYCRGIYREKNLFFRICPKWEKPGFTMLPNGNLYLCCMDFGLRHRIGNLFTERYEIVKQNYKPWYDLCKRCNNTEVIPTYLASKAFELVKPLFSKL